MIRVNYDFIARNQDGKREYGSGYADLNDVNEIDIWELQESLRKDLGYKEMYIMNVWVYEAQDETN